MPELCHSDRDCIETEACFMGICQDPCEFDNVCGIGANCQPIKQRPMCSCPAGHDGDPAVKCSPKICKILHLTPKYAFILKIYYLLHECNRNHHSIWVYLLILESRYISLSKIIVW